MLDANVASIVATPMPCRPRVVPRALTQSPSSSHIWIPWLVKSKSVSEFFCQTISICDWRTTVGWFSYPGEAGLRLNHYQSIRPVSRFKARPRSATNWLTAASFFDGRGTAFKSANAFQRALGSS